MFQNDFNNPYNNPYGNAFPTNGFPQHHNSFTPNYNMPNIPVQTNTNKIFVNGLDEVRNYRLPANSDYVFLDNDKAIIYQKVVDSKGQFEVKAFTITPYVQTENNTKANTEYALKTDIQDIQTRLQKLEVALQGEH